MAQCKLCGRKGFFLSVSKGGVCKSCEPDFLRDCSERTRIVSDCAKVIAESKNMKRRLSRCDLLMEHAQALLRYQLKGVSTTAIPPSEILKKYTTIRKKIIEEIELGSKCPYCDVRLEKLPRTKKKCVACGNIIRVKEGRLYTETAFEKIEEKERLKLIRDLKVYQRQALMNYKKNGVVKYVEISASNDYGTCDTCREWNGKKISLDLAIKENPIPIKGCTSDWCRCTYLPVVDNSWMKQDC